MELQLPCKNGTLLLGLSEGDDFVQHHVYTYKGQVFVHQYSHLYKEFSRKREVSSLRDLVPDTHIYPSLSNMEFLQQLKDNGVSLSYSSPLPHKGNGIYNGRLLPEHSSKVVGVTNTSEGEWNIFIGEKVIACREATFHRCHLDKEEWVLAHSDYLVAALKEKGIEATEELLGDIYDYL